MSRYLLALALTCLSLAGHAAASNTTKEALDQIREFANAMCDEVPLKGSQQSWEMSGEVKAKLAGAIKAAADAGFGGAATYRSEDYAGLLQKDLLAAQQSRNACRKAIFDSLKDKLLNSDNRNIRSAPASTHDVSLTFHDFKFERESDNLLISGVFNNARSNPVTITSLSFLASHGEHEAGFIIGETQWSPLPLPPRAATPCSLTIYLGGRSGLAIDQRSNLPLMLFALVRAVDSNGRVSITTKHFMTLTIPPESTSVFATLFAMPLAILRETTPIYKPEKDVFIVAKPVTRAID
ncbi:hypothetical protein [Cupriavidus basilensis]|uniref:Uncharacterized protein n=1 Tax=Cupriavidus basilensis TaxID=68895 RepID=A0A643FJ35_9BURK|nr:hypothetical protein [Cupriavidus basilensis]QOT76325.1 hypothetical protein F7R26_019715 [Cupriavidus basilensis]